MEICKTLTERNIQKLNDQLMVIIPERMEDSNKYERKSGKQGGEKVS